MITNTREKIITYITKHKQARVHDLVRWLNLSHMAVHKQLNRLVADGVLRKAGKPPLVFYIPAPLKQIDYANIAVKFKLYKNAQVIIENNFLHITPDGKLLNGIEGFIYWQRLYQPKKALSVLIEEYVKIITEKQKHLSSCGWIDASEKLKNTFSQNLISHLLFADFYSYPLFGRTKLAKLVMHAKQAENKELTMQISTIIKPMIHKIIKVFAIDAVGYIPPTVPRSIQFIDELAGYLNLQLPRLNLVKVLAGAIPVPQKTLARLDERIINAQSTIFIKNNTQTQYKNILLIDDVVGSGASFHETAKKLRAFNIGSKSIIAFAIVGNIKGFDIIRQI